MHPRRYALLAASIALAGCGTSTNAATADAGPSPDLADPLPAIGADTEVVIFQTAPHPGGTLEQKSAAVPLPSGLFKSVTLRIELGCPQAGCDPYDRIASVGVLDEANGQEEITEIARYITPYGVRGTWEIDVTDLQPVLTGGARRFRSYVETWAQNGQGWTVTAKLLYKGGVPDAIPLAVIRTPWRELPVGDPSRPAAMALAPQTVTLPVGASRAAVRLFITGHGQGNADNCAEFCDLLHALVVDEQRTGERSIWRDDCGDNPIKNQKGNWMPPRAGWCPGDKVAPIRIDLPMKAGPMTLAYADPTYDAAGPAYENTCRPDGCQQRTCAFNNPCAFDGGLHTDPRYLVSAVVIAYR